MSELQVLSNYTSRDQLELTAFELPQNYSILINKLERLALGLDSAFSNLSLDRRELEVAVTGSSEYTDEFGSPLAAGRGPPPRAAHVHGMGDVEYSRVVSDIWIGVILTLLIVSVIFFICSCFLFHKFQQWKNSYRGNSNEPVEICRRYPPDFEVESLPSYTIVSGLPTYDDALEEFRKAGILLTPPMTVVKLFERDAASKDSQLYSTDSGFASTVSGPGPGPGPGPGDGDNISLSSTCSCGAANNNNSNHNNANMSSSAGGNTLLTIPNSQVIELSPEQLAALSQKRLSLQISFNNSVRRSSRPRAVDLYRQVRRNNMLRSHALSKAAAAAAGSSFEAFPQIHRSTSSSSLSLANGLNMLERNRLQHMQHRGSLY